MSFAKVIYDDKMKGKRVKIDASQWEYDDYDGHHYCDSKTAHFISEINAYNAKQYERQVFPAQNESEEEENRLLHPDKLEEEYSIDDYDKTFQYALNKMNSPTIDTRKVLNALVTIAMRFDRSEVNRFYDEKSKNANNPVVQSRINYILSCYEEDLYMEYQAQQYA